MEATQGTLHLHSAETGAAVTVGLPLCEAPAWYFDAPAAALEEVLVLDDDEVIARRVRRGLGIEDVTSYQDEAQFLAAARAKPGAFLFVDYGFAGKRTGLALIRAEGLSDRAVLFTGRAHFDTELQARALAGGVRIFPKECLAPVASNTNASLGAQID